MDVHQNDTSLAEKLSWFIRWSSDGLYVGVGYGKLGKIIPDISCCPQMDHVTGLDEQDQNIRTTPYWKHVL